MLPMGYVHYAVAMLCATLPLLYSSIGRKQNETICMPVRRKLKQRFLMMLHCAQSLFVLVLVLIPAPLLQRPLHWSCKLRPLPQPPPINDKMWRGESEPKICRRATAR